MNTGKAILAIAAGVAAGAVVGMLFAADKGSVMRKKISRTSEDLADALDAKIDRKFDELLDTVAGKIGKPKIETKQEKNWKPEAVN